MIQFNMLLFKQIKDNGMLINLLQSYPGHLQNTFRERLEWTDHSRKDWVPTWQKQQHFNRSGNN